MRTRNERRRRGARGRVLPARGTQAGAESRVAASGTDGRLGHPVRSWQGEVDHQAVAGTPFLHGTSFRSSSEYPVRDKLTPLSEMFRLTVTSVVVSATPRRHGWTDYQVFVAVCPLERVPASWRADAAARGLTFMQISFWRKGNAERER